MRLANALCGGVAAVCGLMLTSVVLGQSPETLNNLLPNPSFESVEPPAPTPETAAKGAALDAWVPQAWEVRFWGGSVYQCPDDPGQAHSGRRCLHINGHRGHIFTLHCVLCRLASSLHSAFPNV